ncbi:uncharacterized protein LOC131154482 isoform X2 [Malania oleifera]|uniref:uncharacterized protein LOC131154482 isoform X2 n=1 Tax=Malania oleifera TaxID=397392 RepID=UPI0025ADE8CC|nr:uncharacterized protein LOC131154482 isoform X2 [Malania oleifera]
MQSSSKAQQVNNAKMKVKFLSSDEVINLTSGTKGVMQVSTRRSGSSNDPSGSLPSTSKKKNMVPKPVSPRCFSSIQNTNLTVLPGGLKHHALCNMQSCTAPQRQPVLKSTSINDVETNLSAPSKQRSAPERLTNTTEAEDRPRKRAAPAINAKPSYQSTLERLTDTVAEEYSPQNSIASAVNTKPSSCFVVPRINTRYSGSLKDETPNKGLRAPSKQSAPERLTNTTGAEDRPGKRGAPAVNAKSSYQSTLENLTDTVAAEDNPQNSVASAVNTNPSSCFVVPQTNTRYSGSLQDENSSNGVDGGFNQVAKLGLKEKKGKVVSDPQEGISFQADSVEAVIPSKELEASWTTHSDFLKDENPNNGIRGFNQEAKLGLKEKKGKEVVSAPQEGISFRADPVEVVMPLKELEASSTRYCGPLKGENPNNGIDHNAKLGLNENKGKIVMTAPQEGIRFRTDPVEVVMPLKELAALSRRECLAHVSESISFVATKPPSASSSGGNFCSGTCPSNIEASNIEVQERTLQNISPNLRENRQNGPAAEVIWNFEVLGPNVNVGLCEGFIAHPPAKVSRKAYEFSKQIAGVLLFKLHPRCDFWPEIFQIECPDKNDIALYFYPGNFERSRRKYSLLLKFIENQDLVLRSCMGCVELLVCASRCLHEDSQKLDGSFFMWGVYRSLKDSTQT